MTRTLAVIADFNMRVRVWRETQIPKLTQRQTKTMLLIASGLTDAQIARELGITKSVASKHADRVRQKTGMKNRVQVTIYCYENKLIPTNLNQQYRLAA